MLTLALAMFLTTTDQTVHAGGTDVAVRCLGTRTQGQPLVVLEAGGGNGLDVWSRVQSPVAEFSRVCAYDRPTLIRGDIGPRASASPAAVVRTLREVLSALGPLSGREFPEEVLVDLSEGVSLDIAKNSVNRA